MKLSSGISRVHRLSALAGLLVVISLMFVACAPPPAAESGAAQATEATEAPAEAAAPAAASGENVMTGAWVGPCCNPIDFLNPLSAGGGYHWFNKIFSHLVTYNLEYTEIMPDLAESWSISDDSLTWTFNLRPGVTWHDDTPFTAADVIFSIELCLDPLVKCNKAGELSTIAGAVAFKDGTATTVSGLTAVDDNTLQITTDGPNAALLDTMAETFIVQQASMAELSHENLDQNEYWRTQSIGTGPFKFVEFVEGQYIETVAFDNYWRGAPEDRHPDPPRV